MLSLIPWKRNSSLAGGTWMLPLHPAAGDLNRLVNEYLDGFPAASASDSALERDVRVEVRETPDAVIVRAEVPGIDPKELDVRLEGDLLVLSGEKKEVRESDENDSFYSERRYGSFRRAVRLGMPIDAEKVRAEHKNGVVTITLPKAESSRPRKIDVTG